MIYLLPSPITYPIFYDLQSTIYIHSYILYLTFSLKPPLLVFHHTLSLSLSLFSFVSHFLSLFLFASPSFLLLQGNASFSFSSFPHFCFLFLYIIGFTSLPIFKFVHKPLKATALEASFSSL